MSYLNVPRLHFSGNFQADPSTVNNNDANFDPSAQLSNAAPNPNDIDNTSVYWNPNGTHNWILQNCRINGAANDTGPFNSPGTDAIIGATVASAGKYPAKIVDLDPDNQCISQIWGLTLQIAIPNPNDASTPLATVTAVLPPTAFCDLWNRGLQTTKIGMGTMSASFQAVLQNVTWTNAQASPLLTALQAKSPTALSIRFTVDSFQSDSNQENFTFGRVVGTIGPVGTNEAPRSTPRRLAPVAYSPPGPMASPNIFSTYGAAGAVWDAVRSKLIIDFGNSVPTNATPTTSGPSVPLTGWPIDNTTLQVSIPGPSVTPTNLSEGVKGAALVGAACGAPTILGTIPFTLSTYVDYAGIVEISVTDPDTIGLLATQPLRVANTTTAQPTTVVAEDALGRYVDVDVPFWRLNPGDTAQVTLWATRFGAPWNGAVLDVALRPPINAQNGPQQNNDEPVNPPPLWNNGEPASALTLSSASIRTAGNGTGVLTLTAADPGTPRTYPNGEPGPDGQIYWITGSWASWGRIFLFPGSPPVTSPTAPTGTPINVLVFSSHAMPATPTWTADVEPILGNYARMFPYMKTIIDLGDYDSVVANAGAIKAVLNFPPENPHHMPIVRDLSRDKLAMINQWFANQMPLGA